LPDFGKSSSLYFTPGNYIIRVGKMICAAAVEFRCLRFSQQWRGTTIHNTIPDGLNQFDLLVNVEYTGLL